MRDLLAKHRDNAGCYECHRKIDLLGFALESFDPIGGWRTRNEKGTVIDTSGELPNGQRFKGRNCAVSVARVVRWDYTPSVVIATAIALKYSIAGAFPQQLVHPASKS